MGILKLTAYCGDTCTKVGEAIGMGFFVAVMLLLLNLPRVFVWAVDAWKQRAGSHKIRSFD